MLSRLFGFALAAGLLSGCLSLAPKYERGPLPVPASFAHSTADSTPVAALAWPSFYTDPQLRSLIERSLANNRDLRLAVLRVAEARAAFGIQRADQLPTLGLTAEGGRQRTPADLSITGQPMVASQYQVGVGLASWELDFWGRVRDLKDAALENYLATDAARQAATLSLISQVADAYLSLRALDERLALTRATIASRAASLHIFQRRFEVGATSKLDLTQVETLWQQATVLGAELEQTRAAQAQVLQQLVGEPLDLPQARGGLNEVTLMHELPPGLPSDLLSNRPDIVAAEHTLKAGNANIGAARAAFFPRITLTGLFGTASNELDGLFGGGSRAWQFVPNLNLPIFDAGRREANLDLARARQQQALAQYEKTIQTAFREVADALSARHWLTEQVDVLAATVQAQAERKRLAQLRYDHGASPFLEVLDAERALLEAQQQWVRTRRALLASQVALYAALGGGAQALNAPGETSR
ncbi:efflux transporter outer membrane subunit [Bordetella avium]|uniref:efflux transporter outer membrane subunit n=1 Tax=Bordetella avium TaxID=521 RepID=UPI000E691834|nr:efflux transporter outer membrane subunit [Bordetella avium]RIQ19311.1 efflux transporter outer membrane subunit [Bordetella avium]RIQ33479.1 efflux transporter outer membrane subunit [Bordetella avium]